MAFQSPPSEKISSALKEYAEGVLPLKALASKYGIDQRTIKKYAVKEGLPLRTRKESMAIRMSHGWRPHNAQGFSLPPDSSGLVPSQIADMCNVSRDTVYYHLSKTGYHSRPLLSFLVKDGYSPQVVEQISRLYIEERLSSTRIAQVTGVPWWRVLRILKSAGIAIRSNKEAQILRHGLPIPSEDELNEWYEREQLTTEDMAELCQVSPPTVQRWLREASIPLRKPHYGFHGKPQALCHDGHYVHSYYEKIVDDWLSSYHLPHSYNKTLPGSRFRYDFFVGDTYLEVWGLADLPWYEDRARRKRSHYSALGVPLIELFPEDFTYDRIGQKLAVLLRRQAETAG